MRSRDNIVKTKFDFGWKEYKVIPAYIYLAFQYQKGDILDVGCATCQLYTFFAKKGWKGEYYGIDIQKYDDYEYPEGANLIIGDVLEVEFPKADTVVLYNILEHVDEPITLLKKAIKAARQNILINVPKRNEEMWKYGVVEYHQLDKTHKHCGFLKEEVFKLVDIAVGEIKTYTELGKTNARTGIGLWNNIIPKGIVYLLSKIFSSKTFYQEIWCEVVRK
jgi:2-polyprenyl-3-methyl-5-hydroxy-6-metoxy-1,4-benzoquinol methylase